MREVAKGAPNWEETPGRVRTHGGDYMAYLAYRSIPMEELDGSAREKIIWVFLRRLLQ